MIDRLGFLCFTEQVPNMNIVGIGGSLRKGSYSSALLRAFASMAPKNVTFEILSLAEFPLYNADIEENMPQAVKDVKAKIKAADGIVFATPEYNYSTSGVLKNALDWISRPHGDNSLQDKPVALMSTSPGMLGGSRAFYHMQQFFSYLECHPINRPEIIVPMIKEKLDTEGNLTDQKTKEKLQEMWGAFPKWIERLKS